MREKEPKKRPFVELIEWLIEEARKEKENKKEEE